MHQIPSPGERGDREAVGEERRQNRHRNRSVAVYKLIDYCPYSSSVACGDSFPSGEA